jgi:hypothetical protein
MMKHDVHEGVDLIRGMLLQESMASGMVPG